MSQIHPKRLGTCITEYALPTVLILTVGLGGLHYLIGSLTHIRNPLPSPQVKAFTGTRAMSSPQRTKPRKRATVSNLPGHSEIPNPRKRHPNSAASPGKSSS
jgi:hypothetical protein